MKSRTALVRNVERNMVCKAMLRLHPCGFPMVKHTHDEFQDIQLSINYESPALLAMHQLRKGKLRHTECSKLRKTLIQHMKRYVCECV